MDSVRRDLVGRYFMGRTILPASSSPPLGFILGKPYALFNTGVTAAAFWVLALMPIFVGLLITSIGWIASGLRTNK
jgi:hypothetical protein